MPPCGLRGRRQVSYADGEFIVPVASREELPRVVATLVGLGVPVYEAGLVRRSLEDAFVQLVRDHERACGRWAGVNDLGPETSLPSAARRRSTPRAVQPRTSASLVLPRQRCSPGA